MNYTMKLLPFKEYRRGLNNVNRNAPKRIRAKVLFPFNDQIEKWIYKIIRKLKVSLGVAIM